MKDDAVETFIPTDNGEYFIGVVNAENGVRRLYRTDLKAKFAVMDKREA